MTTQLNDLGHAHSSTQFRLAIEVWKSERTAPFAPLPMDGDKSLSFRVLGQTMRVATLKLARDAPSGQVLAFESSVPGHETRQALPADGQPSLEQPALISSDHLVEPCRQRHSFSFSTSGRRMTRTHQLRFIFCNEMQSGVRNFEAQG